MSRVWQKAAFTAQYKLLIGKTSLSQDHVFDSLPNLFLINQIPLRSDGLMTLLILIGYIALEPYRIIIIYHSPMERSV